MDLLDRLLGHDAWTTRKLLNQARVLSDVQFDQKTDVDGRSMRECFTHIIENMEAWTDLMSGVATLRNSDTGVDIDSLLSRLGLAARALAEFARGISRKNAWDKTFQDDFRGQLVGKTMGGGIAHVITHSMHHRAQIMYMFEKLGFKNEVEGDVLGWETETFGWK